MENLLLDLVATLDASFQRFLGEAEAAAGHGELTASQIRYLDAVHASEKPTVSDIAEALGVSRASASSAIANLEAAGYVGKGPASDDRRSIRVFLTERGLAPVRARDEALQSYGEFIRSVLTDEEASQFEAVITKLTARFAGGSDVIGRGNGA